MSEFAKYGLAERGHTTAVQVLPFDEASFKEYLKTTNAKERAWFKKVSNFKGLPDTSEKKRGQNGKVKKLYLGIESNDGATPPLQDMYALASCHGVDMDEGLYALSPDIDLSIGQKYGMALGWAMAAYRFDKFSTKQNGKKEEQPRLVIPKDINKNRFRRDLEAHYYAQDLINTPTNYLGVEAFIQHAEALGKDFGADVFITQGEALADKNNPLDYYPLVYEVGKGAAEAPAMVDIRWGDPEDPAIVLVGKTVVYDSGGYDLKTDGTMIRMKTDMAGGAHALALARQIIDAELPLHVRVLLPVVENSLSNKALRAGDICYSKKGESIEIANTDAEGRLILSDALYEASNPSDETLPSPQFIADFATLGWHGTYEFPNYGVVHSNCAQLSNEFMQAVIRRQEYFAVRPDIPVLQKELEDTPHADLRSCNLDHDKYDDLLAAAFLRHHVGYEVPWLHLDIAPWREPNENCTHLPQHVPDGAQAMGVRSALALIEDRFDLTL